MKKNSFYFLSVLLVFTLISPSFSQDSDYSIKEENRDIAQNISSQDDTTGMSEFISVEKMPSIIGQVKPVYPSEAIKKNETGTVWVKVKVDVNGNPASVIVARSTNSVFDEAAVTAAKGYKFTPAENKGKAVEVWVVIPFKFDLGPEKEKKDGSKECYVQEADEMPSILGGMSSLFKKLSYPESAKKKNIEGKVLIKIYVDESGNIDATNIIKGIGHGCDEAAEKAARSCKFTPAKKDGKNVKAQVILPVQFKLK